MAKVTYEIDETVYSPENVAQAVADYSAHFPSDELEISYSNGILVMDKNEDPGAVFAEFMNYLLSLHV